MRSKNYLKLSLILSNLFLCSSVYAKELKSFTDISDAIKVGNNMKAVIDFSQCSPQIPNLIAYTKVNAVMLRPTYLQFANSSLTTNNPLFPTIAVLENVTYRIADSNNVTISSRTLTLPDYQLKNESTISCKLGVSMKVYAD